MSLVWGRSSRAPLSGPVISRKGLQGRISGAFKLVMAFALATVVYLLIALEMSR